jgi:8-oxo-dGTP pyrophosphatase MutT (NUDIX family)
VSDAFRIERVEPLLHSHVFDVERRTVRHDGAAFTRDVVVHAGAVAILAINDRDEVGFVRQYRAPFDRVTLEIPAGTLDVEGESHLEAARRELREELGVRAGRWTSLGRFTTATGWSNQVMTIFEARELSPVPREPAGPEERSSQVVWLGRGELRDALRREDTLDSTMVVALHRIFGSLFDDR